MRFDLLESFAEWQEVLSANFFHAKGVLKMNFGISHMCMIGLRTKHTWNSFSNAQAWHISSMLQVKINIDMHAGAQKDNYYNVFYFVLFG